LLLGGLLTIPRTRLARAARVRYILTAPFGSRPIPWFAKGAHKVDAIKPYFEAASEPGVVAVGVAQEFPSVFIAHDRRVSSDIAVELVPRLRYLVLNQGPFLLVTIGFFLLNGAVAPAAAAQGQVCPIVAEADVSRAVGSLVHVSPFMVVDSGSAIQCMFEGEGVGEGVLVGRYRVFFGSQDLAAFSQDQDRLRVLLPDGLAPSSLIAVTAVDGVGDVAAWVVPVDPSTAPDSLGRLLVRRGPDAFVIGTENGPGAVNTAKSVAKVLLAAST
jgi:hypothetical protein